MSKRKKKGSESAYQFLTLLPILIVIGFIPLIVRLKILQLPQTDLVWKAEGLITRSDFFSYYKSQAIVLIGLICLAILIYTLVTTKWSIQTYPYLGLLIGYMLLVILSTLFSNHLHVSLIGYDERFEGMFVQLSYVLIFIYTLMFIKEKKQIDLLLTTWIIAIVILFIIGITQYLNIDIIVSNFGRNLIMPSKYKDLNPFGDSDTTRNVYQTLYHYNYVSFYAAVGLPFFLVLAITEKSFKYKMVFYTMTFIFVINQVISLSRNGYIGIIAGFICVIILLRHIIFKYWKIIIPVFSIIFICTITFIFISDSITAVRIRDGFSSLKIQESNKLNTIESKDQSLIINHDSFKIIFEAVSINDTIDFIAKDKNGNLISTDTDTSTKLNTVNGIKASQLSFLTVPLNGVPSLQINIFKTAFYFVYDNNHFLYVNPNLTYSEINSFPSLGFRDREEFASSRGYIWSKSLPLVISNGFLGSGPDTFALEFPQSDYVGKYNAYRTPYIVVDKPHNVFLGYATNTGLLSLLLLLAFWIHYIYSSIKIYLHCDTSDYYNRIGIASLCSAIGYFTSGLFNDTNVSITPTFWLILGIGYSMNYLNKKNRVAH